MNSVVWQIVKPLRAHPLSVGQARNFCARRLASVLDGRDDIDDVVADAATIASELVTNAVAAGSTSIELFIALREKSVLIEVGDDAEGSVVPATPAPNDTTGRGLMVVAALSRQWGVAVDASGKHVWAEVDLKDLDHVA